MKMIQFNRAAAKALIVLLFAILVYQQSHAQTNNGFTYNPLTMAVGVTVHLNNDSVFKGNVIEISDSAITIKFNSNDKNDSNKLDALSKEPYYTIKTEDIKYIKVKRKAFLTGLVTGGLIGYGLGYATGYVTHKYNPGRSDDENNNDAKARGLGAGIIGAASLAAVGSLVAPVILRKKFFINGNRENMHKVVVVISNAL